MKLNLRYVAGAVSCAGAFAALFFEVHCWWQTSTTSYITLFMVKEPNRHLPPRIKWFNVAKGPCKTLLLDFLSAINQIRQHPSPESLHLSSADGAVWAEGHTHTEDTREHTGKFQTKTISSNSDSKGVWILERLWRVSPQELLWLKGEVRGQKQCACVTEYV